MLREWKLHLKLGLKRGDGAGPVYVQIAHGLIAEIRRGRLTPGEVLPGSREMAEELGVNRKTVIVAYDELIAQGWLVSRGTKGTFVSTKLPESRSKPNRAVLDNSKTRGEGPQFSRLAAALDVPVIFPKPGIVLLDDGTPDTRLFPAESFARAYRSAMSLAGKVGKLGYGDPRGSPVLRTAISRMLNMDRGLATTPERVCLTRGSQMAIYLASRILIRTGDAVVVDDLTYPPAREAFRAAGATILRAKVDEGGTDIDNLEKLCRRNRVRVVYLTPHHHFPTTVLLNPARRLRLLALSSQFGFTIIEDDYDHEFHFAHQPLLPLASFDPAILYIGSMSKLLSPSLRIGYISAPEKFIDRAAQEILLIDRQGDQITEEAVAELVDAGEVRRHANRALRVYSSRREKLAVTLRAELGDVVDFRMPDGGLAFWLTFETQAYLDRLEKNAVAFGLSFLPSRSFSGKEDGRRGIRMGFAGLDDQGIREAVRRMKAAIGG
ncbi:MAG: PLP-dependent aminotransferase family protein [Xanthobacteraceae bacterium]|nr:PLP-dependent aminotransferase family protein [Xanthobacteraceae bacterium]